MVSKAIASLDAWLARAEEVLAEQREHAISPSLGLPRDGGRRSGPSRLRPSERTRGPPGVPVPPSRPVDPDRRGRPSARISSGRPLRLRTGHWSPRSCPITTCAAEHHWTRRQEVQSPRRWDGSGTSSRTSPTGSTSRRLRHPTSGP